MSGAGWLRIGFSSLPSTATHPPTHTLRCLTGHSVCIFRVCWHPSSEMVTSSMPYRTFPLSSPTFPSWLGVLWCVSQCLAYSLPCLWWPSHFFLNCLTPVCWRPLLQSNTLYHWAMPPLLSHQDSAIAEEHPMQVWYSLFHGYFCPEMDKIWQKEVGK